MPVILFGAPAPPAPPALPGLKLPPTAVAPPPPPPAFPFGLLVQPLPPRFPCDGSTGGVLPEPALHTLGEGVPPPDPPSSPPLPPACPPNPPPADVIVANVEATPGAPLPPLFPAPPPPTVIAYDPKPKLCADPCNGLGPNPDAR